MTDSEMFNKFDVRIRERLLGAGLLTEEECARHLEQLPDVSNKAEKVDLPQPALVRAPEEPPAPPTAAGLDVPPPPAPAPPVPAAWAPAAPEPPPIAAAAEPPAPAVEPPAPVADVAAAATEVIPNEAPPIPAPAVEASPDPTPEEPPASASGDTAEAEAPVQDDAWGIPSRGEDGPPDGQGEPATDEESGWEPSS